MSASKFDGVRALAAGARAGSSGTTLEKKNGRHRGMSAVEAAQRIGTVVQRNYSANSEFQDSGKTVPQSPHTRITAPPVVPAESAARPRTRRRAAHSLEHKRKKDSPLRRAHLFRSDEPERHSLFCPPTRR